MGGVRGVGNTLHLVFQYDRGAGVVEKPTIALKHGTEGFCWAHRPSLSCFDMMRGGRGQKRPTVTLKHEREVLWAVIGSAEAEQKKCATQGAYFLFGGWRDVLVGLGMC